MKLNIIGMMLFAVTSLLSCNNNASEKKQVNTDTAVHKHHSMLPPAPEKKFAGVTFANEQDYICGMPVRAGVNDTVHYKDKVYGFCAKECKEEFLKNPKQYLTAKK